MATMIVFAASDKDGRPLVLTVEGPGETIAGALSSRQFGLVKLEREGEPIWVNAATVLYVTEAGKARPIPPLGLAD